VTSPYPDLAHLLGAYFHEDFDMYGDEWGVVDAFVSANPARARRVPEQIARLLEDFPFESDVARFTDESGCAYLPPGDGDAYRTWLNEVSAYLSQQLPPS
jgi:hypothetical protein